MTTNTPTPTPTAADLRAKLQELDAAHVAAGTALLDAQTAHTGAIRHALSTGDYSAADATKTVLDACAAAHQQISTTLEIARRMLAETVIQEKQEAEVTARAAMDASLVEIDAIAAEADAMFSSLVSRVQEMDEIERAAFRIARDASLRPIQAPQCRHALRLLARRFEAVADAIGRGDPPKLDNPVAQAVHEARANIQASIRL
jgi:hypothetical protein